MSELKKVGDKDKPAKIKGSKSGKKRAEFKSTEKLNLSSKKAHDFVKKERKKSNTFSRPEVYEGPATSRKKDGTSFDYFPSQYGDEKLKEKITRVQKKFKGLEHFVESDPDVAKKMAVPLVAEDIDTLVDVQKMQELIQFDQEFSKIFHLENFNDLERAIRIYPEYFENKLQFIKKVAALQEALALIQINGINTKADMDLVISARMAPFMGNDMMQLIDMAPQRILEVKNYDSVHLDKLFPGYPRFPYFGGENKGTAGKDQLDKNRDEKNSFRPGGVKGKGVTTGFWNKHPLTGNYISNGGMIMKNPLDQTALRGGPKKDISRAPTEVLSGLTSMAFGS